jgi:hypothetical protein
MAALRVHGLDPVLCQVRGRPSREVLGELIARLGLGPVQVVAHHAAFERAFLEAWARKETMELPEIQWSCTLEQLRALAPGAPFRYRLGDLATVLGWDCGELHRAGCDAALTQRLQDALHAWRSVQESMGPDPGLVYLAGPLRGDGSPAGIRHNQAAMANLCRWAQAILPQAILVVPHLNFAYLDESGTRGLDVRTLALRACERLVARCDALVLCGTPLTEGMRKELAIAKSCGLPVFEVPKWDPPPEGPGFSKQVAGHIPDAELSWAQ